VSFSSSGRTQPRSKWLVLGLLWVVCFLNYADRQVISSLFPILEHDFGFTKAQLGLIGSAFMWVYAFSSPFAGFAGDRYPRKGLIIGGCLLWSLMTGVSGMCGKCWQFIATRAVIGLGESVYFPAATSLLSDWHGQRTRSTALSLHQSAVYIGTIAGGALGAFLAVRYGWRWALYGFGIAGILTALLIGKYLPVSGEESHDPEASAGSEDDKNILREGFLQTLGRILRQPGVLLLMAAFACANGVAAIFLVWAPTFLFEKFHLSLVILGCGGHPNRKCRERPSLRDSGGQTFGFHQRRQDDRAGSWPSAWITLCRGGG